MARYQIKKKAVYEILDTEAVVINFNNGDYYTLPCLAKQIWQMLEKNVATESILSAIISYYQCDSDKTTTEITNFLTQLEEEGLLEIVESAPEKHSLQEILDADAKHQWSYQLPWLYRYSDINNLLMLDPIHDVDDESGWPHQEAPKQEDTLEKSVP